LHCSANGEETPRVGGGVESVNGFGRCRGKILKRLDMIKSMTGFAHKEVAKGNYEVTIDLRTLNHRYCEINLRIPQELSCWEEELRKIIGERVSRGKIDAQLKMKYLENPNFNITLNRQAVEAITSELEKVKSELNVSGEVEINSLLQIPHIIEFEPIIIEAQQELLQLLKSALRSALDKLEESRRKEGEILSQIVKEELKLIRFHTSRIEKHLPLMQQEYYIKLKQKMEEYLGDLPVEENRLLQEVAFLVERSDVTEEINRIKSHLGQSQAQLLSDEPAGRKLDFLMQELHREVSTLGAKWRDAKFLPDILTMKGAVEKIRQQVQNIE